MAYQQNEQGSINFVFKVILFSISSSFKFSVSGLMSTKTGFPGDKKNRINSR